MFEIVSMTEDALVEAGQLHYQGKARTRVDLQKAIQYCTKLMERSESGGSLEAWAYLAGTLLNSR